MNRAQILAKKKAIILRFEEEARAFREEIKGEEFTELGRYRQRMYTRNYAIRLHRCILYEIAGALIAPYHSDPGKIVLNFIRHYTDLFESGAIKRNCPTLHEFFKWYCDSDVINNDYRTSQLKPYHFPGNEASSGIEESAVQYSVKAKSTY